LCSGHWFDRFHRCTPKATGRTAIRIAGYLVANAVTQAAADGAIFEAIFNQSDPQPQQRWPADGNARALLVGNVRVLARLEDEAWWMNPNSASPTLVEALLRATGSDPETAHRLVNAISEWVGSTPIPRPQNVVNLADYRAAGLDYGPPGGPLETLDELGRVLGITPAILAAIRPHLTLYGPPEPSVATIDPFVQIALAGAAQAAPALSPTQPSPGRANYADYCGRVRFESSPRAPVRRSTNWSRAAPRATKCSLGAMASNII
jgi:general secretion pathway protein K